MAIAAGRETRRQWPRIHSAQKSATSRRHGQGDPCAGRTGIVLGPNEDFGSGRQARDLGQVQLQHIVEEHQAGSRIDLDLAMVSERRQDPQGEAPGRLVDAHHGNSVRLHLGVCREGTPGRLGTDSRLHGRNLPSNATDPSVPRGLERAFVRTFGFDGVQGHGWREEGWHEAQLQGATLATIEGSICRQEGSTRAKTQHFRADPRHQSSFLVVAKRRLPHEHHRKPDHEAGKDQGDEAELPQERSGGNPDRDHEEREDQGIEEPGHPRQECSVDRGSQDRSTADAERPAAVADGPQEACGQASERSRQRADAGGPPALGHRIDPPADPILHHDPTCEARPSHDQGRRHASECREGEDDTFGVVFAA